MKIETLANQGKTSTKTMTESVAASFFDIRKDVLRKSFQPMKKIEHRLEFVAKIHEISFWNDSRATNVNATWYALESMKSPTIWIAGGIDNNNNYDCLLDIVKEKVKALICLGTDNKKLINTFQNHISDIIDTHSMEEAVNIAYHLGKKGDAVLLSPACPSFDMFEDYKHRGISYKNAIREL